MKLLERFKAAACGGTQDRIGACSEPVYAACDLREYPSCPRELKRAETRANALQRPGGSSWLQSVGVPGPIAVWADEHGALAGELPSPVAVLAGQNRLELCGHAARALLRKNAGAFVYAQDLDLLPRFEPARHVALQLTPLLVVADLGNEIGQRQMEELPWGLQVFVRTLRMRRDALRPTVITTSLTREQLALRYGGMGKFLAKSIDETVKVAR